ncbi:uncharacterized protein LOC117585237 [Drosophila guanche]|uniref:Uncharacterized protein n=1 Tax=Drosophila guanche TaxID=7266 RepID=A0A3B0JP21_DROGU|nr:uncharacterized protein LOC117585237 [Drosophila guanche]SPP82663.1 Hypothetical predicted protein [Drosophila guanche]
MGYKSFVVLFVASFIVATTLTTVKQCDERHKPGNLKALIAPKASAKPKGATDSPSGCATQKSGNTTESMDASMAAETLIAGNKQLLDALESSLSEIKKFREKMKKAAASSSNTAKMAKRVRNNNQKIVANLKCLYGEFQVSLEKIRSVAENAKREVMEKRKLEETAKRRVEYLKKNLDELQADMKRTRDSAKKANCAAKQAKQRVDTILDISTL